MDNKIKIINIKDKKKKKRKKTRLELMYERTPSWNRKGYFEVR